MAEENGGKTDAAALGGGVVAIAIAIFAEPGPYDLIGVVVAVTLGLLIVGHVWNNDRGPLQSLALGGVCAIVLLAIWGYFADRYKWPLWTDAHQKAISERLVGASRPGACAAAQSAARVIGEPSTVSEPQLWPSGRSPPSPSQRSTSPGRAGGKAKARSRPPPQITRKSLAARNGAPSSVAKWIAAPPPLPSASKSRAPVASCR